MTEVNLSTEEIQAKLAEPFSEEEIEWRVMRSFKAKSGKAYAFVAAYVESRSIMNRLDSVLGLGNWENEFKELHNGILCGIRVHLPDGKSIVKYDGSDLTNIESTKGGISGALKRAAVQWGIGRYLYKLQETRVEIFPDPRKGKIYINDRKQNITGSWNPPQLPNWALPSNKGKQKGLQQNQQNQRRGNQQQSNKGNTQNAEISREKLNGYITKFELEIGLNKSLDYVVRIFNKANNSQVDGINVIRNSPIEELKAYYQALKPIYQLVVIQKNYHLAEDEFLKMVQTFVVESEITNLFSCFFKVNQKHISQIEKLASDTYAQRKAS